jgi:hypothetical protein
LKDGFPLRAEKPLGDSMVMADGTTEAASFHKQGQNQEFFGKL